ncbi:MAG: hypothetical protein AB7L65_11460 [Hyphomonadaceae bacterium]
MQPDAPPFSLPAAWDLLRDALTWLAALFGPPAHLRDQRMQARRDHALLLSWLRSLEAFAARLLLIAAHALALPETKGRAAQQDGRGARADGAAWRARLHLPRMPAPASARPPRAGAGALREAEEEICLAAAARYEGLRRLAQNPLAYARRLARRLRRDGALARRIALAPVRPRDPFAPNAAAAREYLRHYILENIAFSDSS